MGSQKLIDEKTREAPPGFEEGLASVDTSHEMLPNPCDPDEIIWNEDQLIYNLIDYADIAERDSPAIAGQRTFNFYRSEQVGYNDNGEPLLNINPETDHIKSFTLEEIQSLAENIKMRNLHKLQKLADFGAQAGASDEDKLEAAKRIISLLYDGEYSVSEFLAEPMQMHIKASLEAGENAPRAKRNTAYLREIADRLRRLYPKSSAADNIEEEIKRMKDKCPE